jgi:hypothetical protein
MSSASGRTSWEAVNLEANDKPDWNEAYAAQILSILDQAQAAAPLAPGTGQPGIVQPGTPGSLVPPNPVTQTEQERMSVSVAPPDASPVPTTQQPVQSVQAAPQPTFMPQALPQTSPWYHVANAIQSGLSGAFLHPRANAQTLAMLHHGQQQHQQDIAQRQLSTLQQNVQEIARTQGPEAAKAYLVQASRQVRPGVGDVVNKRLQELQTQANLAQGISLLRSGKPEDFTRGESLIMANSEPGEAIKILGHFEPKLQAVQTGNRVFTFNPRSGNLDLKAVVPAEFSASMIGGQDVTQELNVGYPGGISGFQADMSSNDPARQAKAQQGLQQATVGARQREIEGEQRRHSMRLGEAGQSEKINMARDVMRTAKNIEASYNQDFVGPARGRLGWLGEKTGQLSAEETAFRSYVAKLQDDLLRAKSGAAITENEYERMRSFLPDPSQNPEQFRSQLEIFTDQYQQLLNDKVDSAFRTRRQQDPEALKAVTPSHQRSSKSQKAQAPAAQPRQGQSYPTAPEPQLTTPPAAPRQGQAYPPPPVQQAPVVPAQPLQPMQMMQPQVTAPAPTPAPDQPLTIELGPREQETVTRTRKGRVIR